MYRQTTEAAPVDVDDYTQFESLTLKLVCHRARTVTVVCMYRPPSHVSSGLQLSLTNCVKSSNSLCNSTPDSSSSGDFNVPGLINHNFEAERVSDTLLKAAKGLMRRRIGSNRSIRTNLHSVIYHRKRIRAEALLNLDLTLISLILVRNRL